VADKAEVSVRAAWAGAAVNLKTGNPTPEQVREGVDKLLGDKRYKERAMELREENIKADALGTIEKIVEEFTE
jgi:UDP:flavonoid glycosyltransferase YjiC (YdhE family)